MSETASTGPAGKRVEWGPTGMPPLTMTWCCIVLGWHVTKLSTPTFRCCAPPRQPRKLPGDGDLDTQSQAGLLLEQVGADVRRLWSHVDSGLRPPDTCPIRSLLQAGTRERP